MGLQAATGESIPRVGRVREYRWLDRGPGTRVARDLLCRWTTASARYCAQHMRAIRVPEDLPPFVFGERQLATFLTPALYSTTRGAMKQEARARRKVAPGKGAQDSGEPWETSGRVDFWCRYRQIAFAIEVKHEFLAIQSGVMRQQLSEAWSKANSQLDEIKQQAREWADERGAMRIALAVVPFYYGGENSGEVTDDELCEQGLLRLRAGLRPFPDWALLWCLHNDLVGPYEYTNGKEWYPALAFVAHVRDLQR